MQHGAQQNPAHLEAYAVTRKRIDRAGTKGNRYELLLIEGREGERSKVLASPVHTRNLVCGLCRGLDTGNRGRAWVNIYLKLEKRNKVC